MTNKGKKKKREEKKRKDNKRKEKNDIDEGREKGRESIERTNKKQRT